MQIISADLSFGQALEALKQGKEVKRVNWGGFWFMESKAKVVGKDFNFNLENVILSSLKLGGGVVPAQPYQQDILAEDWQIVDPYANKEPVI